MKRQAFLAYLVRAVKENFLTEQEAVALLRRFDSGDIDESMLPLDLSEAIFDTTDDAVQRGMIALTALGVITSGGFKRLTESQQEKVATKLQERFAKEVRGFAYKSLEDLGGWQRSMNLTIQEHIIQQSLLGRLRPLEPQEVQILDRVIKTQLAYASRFADEQSIRLLQGNPFSVDYIGARSEQYNGEARAEFYRAKEGDAEDGMIFQYIAVDDSGTCQSCLDAEGFYLPASGFMPGEVCEGRGFCRCVREEVFDPKMAAELQDELRAA